MPNYNTENLTDEILAAKTGGIATMAEDVQSASEVNAVLNAAYEILSALPKMADAEFEARLQTMVEQLDDMTRETCEIADEDRDQVIVLQAPVQA